MEETECKPKVLFASSKLPASAHVSRHLHQRQSWKESSRLRFEVSYGAMLHKAFSRNRLTTKYFQHFSLEKPATDLEVTRSQVYWGQSSSMVSCTGDAHPLCSLLPQQTSRQTITQSTPNGFTYRAPYSRFPTLTFHSLMFLPSSSTCFWWLLGIYSLTAQYPPANCCHLHDTLTYSMHQSLMKNFIPHKNFLLGRCPN